MSYTPWSWYDEPDLVDEDEGLPDPAEYDDTVAYPAEISDEVKAKVRESNRRNLEQDRKNAERHRR